jgi:maltooligosyltrehalose trehalohydrolase
VRWEQREARHEILALHRDLIALRKSDPVISAQPGITTCSIDGAVLSDNAFVLRYFAADGMDRLVIMNLGARFHADPIAEPLLGPPPGMRWALEWSSEDSKYGGLGTPEVEVEGEGWWIHAQCTVLMLPEPADDQATSR